MAGMGTRISIVEALTLKSDWWKEAAQGRLSSWLWSLDGCI